LQFADASMDFEGARDIVLPWFRVGIVLVIGGTITFRGDSCSHTCDHSTVITIISWSLGRSIGGSLCGKKLFHSSFDAHFWHFANHRGCYPLLVIWHGVLSCWFNHQIAWCWHCWRELFEFANLVHLLVNPSSGLHDLNRNEDIHPRKKIEWRTGSMPSKKMTISQPQGPQHKANHLPWCPEEEHSNSRNRTVCWMHGCWMLVWWRLT
jgi:hypothetical protein